MDASFVSELGQVNAVLLALCHERGCAFVATARPPITDPSGSLNPEMAADRLHLGPEGYSHLARWLTEDGGALGQLLQTD
jgi:lysophospholipase L1-like esterase